MVAYMELWNFMLSFIGPTQCTQHSLVWIYLHLFNCCPVDRHLGFLHLFCYYWQCFSDYPDTYIFARGFRLLYKNIWSIECSNPEQIHSVFKIPWVATVIVFLTAINNSEREAGEVLITSVPFLESDNEVTEVTSLWHLQITWPSVEAGAKANHRCVTPDSMAPFIASQMPPNRDPQTVSKLPLSRRVYSLQHRG